MLEPLEQRTLLSVWYVDDDALAGGDGTSTSSPFDTIQEGINAAANSDTVEVAAGTYNESLTWNAKDISLIGAGAAVTIVDASGTGGRCLTILDVSDTASLEGFTLTNGSGGGMYLEHSSLTIENCTITENASSSSGGGIYLNEASPTLIANTISLNSSGPNRDGGGMFATHCSPTLIGNTITGNVSQRGGGGVFLDQSSPSLTNNEITDNTANSGAGVSMVNASSPLLEGNTISENAATGHGGGVFMDGGAPVLVANILNDNTADGDGGGICATNHANPTLTDNQLTNNFAALGGGAIFLDASTGTYTRNEIRSNHGKHGGGLAGFNVSDPKLDANTFIGNDATIAGGAVYLWNSYGVLTNNVIAANTSSSGGAVCLDNAGPTLTNDTITGNTSGGVYHGGWRQAVITNCILWGNTGGDDLSGASATYSDVGTGNTAGTGNISADPLFSDTGIHDYHLLEGSRCIDAGDDAAPSLPATDKDGHPRIYSAHVDMGPYESYGTAWYVDDDAPYDPGPDDSSVSDPAEDGSSAHPYDEIQEALDAAANGGVVLVRAGTYRERLTWNQKDILLIGAGAEATTVDAEQLGRCLTMTNVPDTATLTGFTFTGGSADSGGGLYLYESSPTLTENVITGNSAVELGGGLYLYHSSSTLANNDICTNETTGTSTGGRGGGLYIDGNNPTLTGNTISGNSAATYGGGLYVTGWSPALTENTITGNSAGSWGGGLFVNWSSAILTDNTITANTAVSGGGGLRITGRSSPTLTGNTVQGNSTNGSGGGLRIDKDASPTLTSNTITGNTKEGILCQGSSPTIDGNVITGNTGDGIVLLVIYNSGGDPAQEALDLLSEPTIVANTIEANGPWGIRCEDTAAANAATLEADNMLGANGSGQVLQRWYGLVRVVNYDLTPAVGASVRIFNNDGDTSPDYGSPFTSGADGYAPGSADPTDSRTWPLITGFQVGNDGTRATMTPQTIDAELDDAYGGTDHAWDGRYQIVQVRLNTPPVANDDAYDAYEDTVLAVPAPGILENDYDVDLPVEGSTLNYDADGETDLVWQSLPDVSQNRWYFTGADVGVTLDTGVSSLPGITQAYTFTGAGGASNRGLNDLPDDPSDNAASWEFWIKPDSGSDVDRIFETGGGGDGMSIVYDGSANQIVFTVDNSAVQRQVSGGSSLLDTSEFHQVVAVYHRDFSGYDDVIRLYIDGVLVDDSDPATAIGPDDGPDVATSGLNDWDGGDWSTLAVIGTGLAQTTPGDSNYEGQIAKFRFYEWALTGGQVTVNYIAIAGQLVVTQVNGDPANVGVSVTLVSGATLIGKPDGSFTYDPNGQFEHLAVGETASDTFTYTAEDGGGETDTATVTITINGVNDAPVADADGPYTVDEGGTVTLDASGSYDPDDPVVPLTFQWDLDGDGIFGETGDDAAQGDELGMRPVFSAVNLDGPDTATVTLRVTDDLGYTGTDTALVNVANVAPTATLGNDGPQDEGSAVTVSFSDQTDPGTSDTFVYSFDWDNDGTYEIVDQASASAAHTWYEDGTYTVGARIQDDDGGATEYTTDVTVLDLGPTAAFSWSPEPQAEGSPVQFSDLSTSEPDAIVSWSWDFGGLGTSTEQNPQFTFVDDGGYTVSLTVTDDDGSTDIVSDTVTVNNVAPTLGDAVFEIKENSPNGTAVGVVTGSDPGNDTLTYSIESGNEEGVFGIDDPTTGEITVADGTLLDFESTPSFTLKVQVADDDGGVGTATVTINLLNQASITGVVFVDVNENGVFEANEPGIDGVTIELLDADGNPVPDAQDSPLTATTSDGGFYLFEDLAIGTYRVHEIQPTGVDDGAEILGSLGGSIPANDTMQLDLERLDAADYVFAELGQQVASGDTAGIGFWQNKHGQALIRQGGTDLANWLTDNFVNVFGDELLDGDGDVASFFKDQLFRQKGKKSAGPAKVDAQFMAVALATYFTSSNLAENVASDYGFNVTETGIGTKVVNVGDNGAAFEVADATDLTIMQLLLATDGLTDEYDELIGFAHIYDQDGDSEIDESEAALRVMANEVYAGINEQGEI